MIYRQSLHYRTTGSCCCFLDSTLYDILGHREICFVCFVCWAGIPALQIRKKVRTKALLFNHESVMENEGLYILFVCLFVLFVLIFFDFREHPILTYKILITATPTFVFSVIFNYHEERVPMFYIKFKIYRWFGVLAM